jgi:hypothetical protein
VHAVAGPGLGQDPADVGLDGGFGQHQVGGDLAVGQAARHDYARLDGEVKAVDRGLAAVALDQRTNLDHGQFPPFRNAPIGGLDPCLRG